jgi:hypothetical protein
VVPREFEKDTKFSELSGWRGPRPVWERIWCPSLSPHSINSFWQDRTESKKSFDRTSLDLICPICLICGLQADLYPQVESGGGSRTIPHSVEVCCTMLELKLHKSRLKIATGELS